MADTCTLPCGRTRCTDNGAFASGATFTSSAMCGRPAVFARAGRGDSPLSSHLHSRSPINRRGVALPSVPRTRCASPRTCRPTRIPFEELQRRQTAVVVEVTADSRPGPASRGRVRLHQSTTPDDGVTSWVAVPALVSRVPIASAAVRARLRPHSHLLSPDPSLYLRRSARITHHRRPCVLPESHEIRHQ